MLVSPLHVDSAWAVHAGSWTYSQKLHMRKDCAVQCIDAGLAILLNFQRKDFQLSDIHQCGFNKQRFGILVTAIYQETNAYLTVAL